MKNTFEYIIQSGTFIPYRTTGGHEAQILLRDTNLRIPNVTGGDSEEM